MIRNRAILTLSAFGAMFFLGVGTAIIGAASRNIGLTPSQIGLMVSIQNVGFVISVVTVGSLADSVQKTRLLAGASLILAVSFALFYYQDPFILNLIIMLAIGVGIGGYEGAAEPGHIGEPLFRDIRRTADRTLPDILANGLEKKYGAVSRGCSIPCNYFRPLAGIR
jgi:MFS family permease